MVTSIAIGLEKRYEIYIYSLVSIVCVCDKMIHGTNI